MGIISTLKAVLGVGGDREADHGTSVTVEREPRSVDDGSTADEDERAAPAERAVKGMDDATTADEPISTPEAAGSDESVDVIKGIGAAYAERLGEAGVETVADLAGADADALAESTGLGAGRIEGWIERARARTE